MTKYKCFFDCWNKKMTVVSQFMTDFKDGFWLNEKYEFEWNGESNKFWIPASQIRLIERIEEETVEPRLLTKTELILVNSSNPY